MFKQKRAIALLISVALVLTIILASCAGGGKVKLVMVESLTSPQRTKVLKEIIGRFEKENPNITIELVSPPLEGADQKIRQMLLNKNDIDILEVRDWTVLEFSQNGYLEPMDDYINKWEGKSTLSKNVELTGTRAGGKYFMFPYGFYQKMLYYRSDWLEEAGIAVPKTWNELLAAGEKLTDPAAGRYGWTLRGMSGGQSMIIDLTNGKLGPQGIVVDDCYFMPNGKTIFTTPEAVESFNFMKDLYEKTAPKDAISWGFPDQCQAFTSGITAFLYQDPEVVAICDESMEKGTWSTAPIVVDDKSGLATFGLGYGGWGITSHSKYKDEAWKFISFLNNDENNVIFCEKYSVIPIHTNAGDKSEFFKSGPFAPYITMAADPDHFFLTSGAEKYAENNEFGTNAEKDYQNVLQGKLSVEDCLKTWDEYWTKVKAKQ